MIEEKNVDVQMAIKILMNNQRNIKIILRTLGKSFGLKIGAGVLQLIAFIFIATENYEIYLFLFMIAAMCLISSLVYDIFLIKRIFWFKVNNFL